MATFVELLGVINAISLRSLAGLAILISEFVAVVEAVDLKVVNPTFESNSVERGATSPRHKGWTRYGTTGNAVTWAPTSCSFVGENGSLPPPASGPQCLWLTGGPNIYQVYSYLHYIEADNVYTLTAAIGAPLDRDFGDYALVLASPDGEIVSRSGIAGRGYADIANRSGRFYDRSISFSTGKGGRADLIGKMLIVNLSGNQAAIDNVRLSVARLAKSQRMQQVGSDDALWDTTTLIAAICLGLTVYVFWIWKHTR